MGYEKLELKRGHCLRVAVLSPEKMKKPKKNRKKGGTKKRLAAPDEKSAAKNL